MTAMQSRIPYEYPLSVSRSVHPKSCAVDINYSIFVNSHQLRRAIDCVICDGDT